MYNVYYENGDKMFKIKTPVQVSFGNLDEAKMHETSDSECHKLLTELFRFYKFEKLNFS